MARRPRFAVAGQPHLVIQTGRGPDPVFVDDVDRRFYLDALRLAARACDVAVHAYALTPDSAWLLATPRETRSLGEMMQRVGRRFVPHHHARHGARGPLWADRFRSAAVAPETHLLTAIRFVEQAPVRCGVVTAAREWPWSSAQHHVGDSTSLLITEHPGYWRLGNTPFEREARHLRELDALLTPAQASELASAVRGGWPVGPEAFIAAIAAESGRPVRPRPRGRPRGSTRQEPRTESVPK